MPDKDNHEILERKRPGLAPEAAFAGDIAPGGAGSLFARQHGRSVW